MNELYGEFKKLKQKQNDIKNEERAGITMLYYDKIGEMIGSGDFVNQENFLYSVQQFIEEKEFITDKQIEIIERIYNDIHAEIPF